MEALRTQTMNATPPLRITAVWDGRGVTETRVRDERPLPAQALVGQPVEHALALLPTLLPRCSHAQTLTAQAAIAAARGQPQADETGRIGAERVIAAEAAQAHLGRLLLDWPALFGYEPRRGRFGELYRQLGRLTSHDSAEGARDLGGQLLDLVASEMLAGFFMMAREPSSLAEFASRARRGGSVGAALGDLLEMGTHVPPQGMVPLLPSLSAQTWAQTLGDVPDENFCRTPSWQGAAAETGALARTQESMLVRLLMQRGHPVAARLFAQVVDLSDCASRLRHPLADDMPAMLDAAALGDNAGLACCESAGGVLIHALRLNGDLITDYAIITPSAWNFHPAGAFALESRGWQAPDQDSALCHLKALALGLTPCRPFEIQFGETADA